MRLLAPASSFVSALLFTSLLFAKTTGTIRCSISDSDHQPVPGVTVTINSAVLAGGMRTDFTNESGEFRFSSLPIGIYVVDVSLQGFQALHSQNIKVNSGV